MRGRGLKLIYNGYTLIQFLVAPHAGAWIETSNPNQNEMDLATSPPMRGRGLKL